MRGNTMTQVAAENLTAAAGTPDDLETILYLSELVVDLVKRYREPAACSVRGSHGKVLACSVPDARAAEGGVALCRVTATADQHAQLRRDARNRPLPKDTTVEDALLMVRA